MSLSSLFNFGRHLPSARADGRTEYVTTQRVLQRVLSFTGPTIHDVINDPVARQKVSGYYKLHKWVERESEVSDLERQWTALPRG
jgi:hypothetical protein